MLRVHAIVDIFRSKSDYTLESSSAIKAFMKQQKSDESGETIDGEGGWELNWKAFHVLKVELHQWEHVPSETALICDFLRAAN